MGNIRINDIIYGSDNASDIAYKNTTVEEKLDTIPVFDPSDNQHIEANQYDYLTYGHIVDSLNSTDDSKTLSAKQGKILNDKIDAVAEENGEDIEDLMITVNTLKNINKLTQAEYNELPEDERNTGIYVITDAEGLTAKTLDYDDSKSGIGVNNVQDAIDKMTVTQFYDNIIRDETNTVSDYYMIAGGVRNGMAMFYINVKMAPSATSIYTYYTVASGLPKPQAGEMGPALPGLVISNNSLTKICQVDNNGNLAIYSGGENIADTTFYGTYMYPIF